MKKIKILLNSNIRVFTGLLSMRLITNFHIEPERSSIGMPYYGCLNLGNRNSTDAPGVLLETIISDPLKMFSKLIAV